MIKYLGSKRSLLGSIRDVVRQLTPPGSHILDLFSGTSRVGFSMKANGYRVTSNDLGGYAYILAMAHVQADDIWTSKAEALIRELNDLPGKDGFITETYCVKSRFFRPENGRKIDAVRERIEELDIQEPELKAIVLTSLIEAADQVDSTCALQTAYLKSYCARALGNMRLYMPTLLPQPAAGKCHAMNMDALEAVKQVTADLAYLDPPYNGVSYAANYHIWETLVRWDNPETFGVAHRRMDTKTKASAFNVKAEARGALAQTIAGLNTSHVILSLNDESTVTPTEAEALVKESFPYTQTLVIPYRRYLGSKTGGGRMLKAESSAPVTENNELMFIGSKRPFELKEDTFDDLFDLGPED